jgi:hypothetical protein
MTEQIEASPKKVRGMARKSLDLIETMAKIAKAGAPISVRGVCYKLFTLRLIPSMAKTETNRVGRLLRIAREQGTISWDWIVDEAREFERVPS